MLQGCAAYTVASTATYVATGKSLTDHGVSTLAQGDCNGIRHAIEGKYYCEMPVRYNRNAF